MLAVRAVAPAVSSLPAGCDAVLAGERDLSAAAVATIGSAELADRKNP
jgi:hypothetical protein